MAPPLLKPNHFFFQGPHQPFHIGIPLRILITGKGLPNPQRRTGLRKGFAGRLTAIVTHPTESLFLHTVGNSAPLGPSRGLAANPSLQTDHPPASPQPFSYTNLKQERCIATLSQALLTNELTRMMTQTILPFQFDTTEVQLTAHDGFWGISLNQLHHHDYHCHTNREL